MERQIEASRSQDERSPSQELKSQKSDCPVWNTGVSAFLKKFLYPTQRAM
jgi:hypothetical protein